MSKARLIITAVVLEGRSQAQVARDYRVSQAWVSRLVARYHHRTVAAHLDHYGVPRRMNARKFTNKDVDEAARRYRAGESLATVCIAFNVDAATVRRELHRAGEIIRPRRGWKLTTTSP